MMRERLSKTALVVHELGLATGFGGYLFGKAALDPSVKILPSEEQRGKLVTAAWGTYGLLNAVALGASALTWYVGRAAISGRSLGRDFRKLIALKDVLMGTTLLTGIGNYACGAVLAKKALNDELPIETGMTASEKTPPSASRWQKAVTVLGTVNLLSIGGVIATTSVLNFKAGRSHRWAGIARLLP